MPVICIIEPMFKCGQRHFEEINNSQSLDISEMIIGFTKLFLFSLFVLLNALSRASSLVVFNCLENCV